MKVMNIPSAMYGPYSIVIFCFSTSVRSVQLQTSTRAVTVVTNACTPNASRWTGTMGSSGTAVSVADPKCSLCQLTSQQCANRPETQGEVVEQLHPHERAKPRGGSALEELVIVCIDVELAESPDKIGLKK